MEPLTVVLESPSETYLLILILCRCALSSRVNEACAWHIPYLGPRLFGSLAQVHILEISPHVALIKASKRLKERFRHGDGSSRRPGHALLNIDAAPVCLAPDVTMEWMLAAIVEPAGTLYTSDSVSRGEYELRPQHGVWMALYRHQ